MTFAENSRRVHSPNPVYRTEGWPDPMHTNLADLSSRIGPILRTNWTEKFIVYPVNFYFYLLYLIEGWESIFFDLIF